MYQIDQNSDGKISLVEFTDFYTNLSPNFEHDKLFEKYVSDSWNV